MKKIIIGGLVIGQKLNKKESINFLKLATDHGIKDIDTGSLYGNGNSEEIISLYNKKSSQKLRVHTKIGLIKKELKDKSFGVDLAILTPEYIKKASKLALKKLGSERIERLSLHSFCKGVPIEEQVGSLSELVKDGVIKTYGICNFEENELKKWITTCSKNNLILPSGLDVNFNILEQKARIKIFPLLDAYSIKAIPYRVFCRGLLAGRYKDHQLPIGSRAFNSWRVKRFINENNIEIVQKLNKIAIENNLSLIQLVLNWTFSFNAIDSICIGTSSKEQLKEITEANNKICNPSNDINDLISGVIDINQAIREPSTFFEK